VTARKPLVPPDLRELIGLMRDLSVALPIPAGGVDSAREAWQAREERRSSRASVLRAYLHSVAVQLELGPQYPHVEADMLTRDCQRSIAAIRQELAKPLGYEPEPGREAE
jgi:hypothetical protein